MSLNFQQQQERLLYALLREPDKELIDALYKEKGRKEGKLEGAVSALQDITKPLIESIQTHGEPYIIVKKGDPMTTAIPISSQQGLLENPVSREIFESLDITDAQQLQNYFKDKSIIETDEVKISRIQDVEDINLFIKNALKEIPSHQRKKLKTKFKQTELLRRKRESQFIQQRTERLNTEIDRIISHPLPIIVLTSKTKSNLGEIAKFLDIPITKLNKSEIIGEIVDTLDLKETANDPIISYEEYDDDDDDDIIIEKGDTVEKIGTKTYVIKPILDTPTLEKTKKNIERKRKVIQSLNRRTNREANRLQLLLDEYEKEERPVEEIETLRKLKRSKKEEITRQNKNIDSLDKQETETNKFINIFESLAESGEQSLEEFKNTIISITKTPSIPTSQYDLLNLFNERNKPLVEANYDQILNYLRNEPPPTNISEIPSSLETIFKNIEGIDLRPIAKTFLVGSKLSKITPTTETTELVEILDEGLEDLIKEFGEEEEEVEEKEEEKKGLKEKLEKFSKRLTELDEKELDDLVKELEEKEETTGFHQVEIKSTDSSNVTFFIYDSQKVDKITKVKGLRNYSAYINKLTIDANSKEELNFPIKHNNQFDTKTVKYGKGDDYLKILRISSNLKIDEMKQYYNNWINTSITNVKPTATITPIEEKEEEEEEEEEEKGGIEKKQKALEEKLKKEKKEFITTEKLIKEKVEKAPKLPERPKLPKLPERAKLPQLPERAKSPKIKLDFEDTLGQIKGGEISEVYDPSINKKRPLTAEEYDDVVKYALIENDIDDYSKELEANTKTLMNELKNKINSNVYKKTGHLKADIHFGRDDVTVNVNRLNKLSERINELRRKGISVNKIRNNLDMIIEKSNKTGKILDNMKINK